MSTDAVDTTSEQPSVAEVGDQQPGKVMRIAATIKTTCRRSPRRTPRRPEPQPATQNA
jgi:hypothetical protein